MKNLILSSIFLLSSLAFAGQSDWSINNEQGDYWLNHKTYKKLKAKITKRTGETRIIETKDVGNNYELIVYYSGAAGTFNLVNIYYAVIFDKKKKQFIGDYPWKYESQSGKDVPNPKWEISEKSISIYDEQTALRKTIKLESN